MNPIGFLLFSCPGSSTPTLGQCHSDASSLKSRSLCPNSVTATLEFGHKDRLLRFETSERCLANRQNESLILWSQTPSWTGKMCTFNYFRVVKIRSKCKFFPECWFHKAEKGQIFRCSLLVLGSKLNLKFRRSSNFWMLNMQSFKQKINILPADFPIELSVFNSFDMYLFVSQAQF